MAPSPSRRRFDPTWMGSCGAPRADAAAGAGGGMRRLAWIAVLALLTGCATTELLDDVVEEDQVLEPVAVTEVERRRLGRGEGDRGRRHVAQKVHGQGEVEVLTLGRRRRRNGDHAALGVEDRSAAAPRADRRR